MKMTIVAAGAALAVYAGASQADTIPERLMSDLRQDFSLQAFQAAGIVGALAVETGNFRYMQELNPIVKGSRGGIGYSQWTGPRRLAFEAWAGPEVDLTTYEVNYGFLKEELEGEYASVVDRVRDTDTVREATNVFMRRYLRPHKNHRALSTRVAYAEAYLSGDFTGAGCQSTHEVTVDGRIMAVAMCDETNGIANDEILSVQALYPVHDAAEAPSFTNIFAGIPDPFEEFTSVDLSWGEKFDVDYAVPHVSTELSWNDRAEDEPGSPESGPS